MYVCLCKGLTEAEVARRCRDCIAEGVRCAEDAVEAVGICGEEICGFCVESPQLIQSIFEDELEAHLGYSSPSEQPVSQS